MKSWGLFFDSLSLSFPGMLFLQHLQHGQDWAAEHPDEFEALKVDPKGLPANIRSQGERVRELMLETRLRPWWDSWDSGSPILKKLDSRPVQILGFDSSLEAAQEAFMCIARYCQHVLTTRDFADGAGERDVQCNYPVVFYDFPFFALMSISWQPQDGSQELQETFQQILQTAQLTDSALLLEAAVDQELQRVRTVRSLNSLLRNQPTKE